MQQYTGYDTNASTKVPRGKGAIDENQKNVLDSPLHQHSSRASYAMASKALPPSVFKAGFCDAETPVAVTLTQSFLDFASKNGGINLKAMGVKSGQKWCIETSRWKDLVQEEQKVAEIPPVNLNCTHAEALKKVELDTLKKYAIPSV